MNYQIIGSVSFVRSTSLMSIRLNRNANNINLILYGTYIPKFLIFFNEGKLNNLNL